MTRGSHFTVAVLAASLSILLTLPTLAEDVTVGALKISAPWARATPKGASVAGGYMKVTNIGSEPDRLIGGASEIAGRFELHEMSMDNGVMKMRMLAKGIEIKPGQTVEFKPGSYHVMFMELKRPLVQGQHVKATLKFEKAGKADVDFSVAGVGAQSPAASGGMHNGRQMKH